MEELTGCPACGGSDWLRITDRGLDFTGQRIHSCCRCGLFFQSPRLAPDTLQHFYAEEFSRRFRGAVTPDAEALASRDRIARYRFERLRMLGVLAPGRTLLEIGCGAGNFLRLCAGLGMYAWGVEPSSGYAAHARAQGLSVETGVFPEKHGQRTRYDVIALFHVLEHLPHPLATLEVVGSLLDPGGHLVVEVPDLGRALGLRWSEKYFHAPHLIDFTSDSLEYVLNRAGFEVRSRHFAVGSRARRHHLLVTAGSAPGKTAVAPDERRSRKLVRRLRRWLLLSRITRPTVVGIRRLLVRARQG